MYHAGVLVNGLIEAIRRGGEVTHTAPSKYHDEIISLAFIHTNYGEPIAIMVFRRAMQKVLCLSPPAQGANALAGCCDRAVADGVTSYPELAARFGELERQVASA
jgi:hypothetical protein